ncbi:MAG: prepilin-type N-terminal cleavage/methylation domain-containing protein [Planctomycetota bacterium]|jgi:prepilin-type N-terminal cleavage/methylation domain-containing protein
MKVNCKTRLKGFTVSELLMVVVIIGLITGAGAGLYVGTFKKMQVEKAAQDFFLTAKYARLMAVEEQNHYKMELDLANNSFYLTTVLVDEESGQAQQEIVRNMYCKPVEFQGEVVFEAVEIAPSGWETQSVSEEQQTIVFSPNGTAQSSVVQIGDGQTHYSISISPATGRAKIFFGTAENVTFGTTDLEAES